jgi:hypothetical protein
MLRVNVIRAEEGQMYYSSLTQVVAAEKIADQRREAAGRVRVRALGRRRSGRPDAGCRSGQPMPAVAGMC